MTRQVISVRSELDEFAKDLDKFGKEHLLEAQVKAVAVTLEKSRAVLQRTLNSKIEGGPATQFFAKQAVGYNVGRFGKVSTGRKQQPVTVKDFETTKSGRIFINDIQAEILEPSLEGDTRNKIKYPTSNSTQSPFTIPDNLRSLFLKDKDGKKLILKTNKKGNVIRYRSGSLGDLRDAARAKPKGNKRSKLGKGPYSKYKAQSDDAKYFEVLKDTTAPNGFKLYPGIYRRETNKAEGDKLRSRLIKVISYQKKITYKKKNYPFEQLAEKLIKKNFIKALEKEMDKAVKESGLRV